MAGEVQKPESKPPQRPKTLGIEPGNNPPPPVNSQSAEPVQTQKVSLKGTVYIIAWDKST